MDRACGGGETHGHTAHLTSLEIDDLIAFPETLQADATTCAQLMADVSRWLVGIDADGNDMRLAERLAAMTPEQRAASERNLRQWIESARQSLEKADRSEPAGEV